MSTSSSASIQKRKAAVLRLRTQPKSRLTKINLVNMLKKPEAWSSLSESAQEHLYSLLPPPFYGEAPCQTHRNPFHTSCGKYLELACVKWQQELAAGYHTKTHRSHKVETVWEDLPAALRQEKPVEPVPENVKGESR